MFFFISFYEKNKTNGLGMIWFLILNLVFFFFLITRITCFKHFTLQHSLKPLINVL